MRDLLRRRESRNAAEETLVQVQQARGVEMLVLPRKRQERIVMEVSKQQSLLSERMRLTRIGRPRLIEPRLAEPTSCRTTSCRIVPFPFRLERRLTDVHRSRRRSARTASRPTWNRRSPRKPACRSPLPNRASEDALFY